MNIYECDICGAISKPKIIFTHMNEIIEELPDNWKQKGSTTICENCINKLKEDNNGKV
jgi:hypothetical protein